MQCNVIRKQFLTVIEFYITIIHNKYRMKIMGLNTIESSKANRYLVCNQTKLELNLEYCLLPNAYFPIDADIFNR